MTHYRLLIAGGSASGALGYGILGGSGHGKAAGYVVEGPDYGMLFGFILILVAMICATVIICTLLRSKKP